MGKRVVIVDKQPVVVAGVTSMLQLGCSCNIIGEFNLSNEVLLFLGETSVLPDLIILDPSAYYQGGVSLLNSLLIKYPSIKLLIFCSSKHIEYYTTYYEKGKVEILDKDVMQNKLLERVNTLLHFRNEEEVKANNIQPYKHLTIHPKLTKREREILNMINMGMTSKKIAEHLNLSTRTIENHRNNLSNKLNVHSTVELLKIAKSYGLLLA